MSKRDVLVDKDLALLGHNGFSRLSFHHLADWGELIVVGSDIGPIPHFSSTLGTESGGVAVEIYAPKMGHTFKNQLHHKLSSLLTCRLHLLLRKCKCKCKLLLLAR